MKTIAALLLAASLTASAQQTQSPAEDAYPQEWRDVVAEYNQGGMTSYEYFSKMSTMLRLLYPERRDLKVELWRQYQELLQQEQAQREQQRQIEAQQAAEAAARQARAARRAARRYSPPSSAEQLESRITELEMQSDRVQRIPTFDYHGESRRLYEGR